MLGAELLVSRLSALVALLFAVTAACGSNEVHPSAAAVFGPDVLTISLDEVEAVWSPFDQQARGFGFQEAVLGVDPTRPATSLSEAEEAIERGIDAYLNWSDPGAMSDPWGRRAPTRLGMTMLGISLCGPMRVLRPAISWDGLLVVLCGYYRIYVRHESIQTKTCTSRYRLVCRATAGEIDGGCVADNFSF